MRKEFGNTWTEFKKILLFGLLFGVVATAAIVGVNYSNGKTDDLPKTILVIPTLFFSIWIEDGVIRHMCCRRWQLSQGKVAELERVEVAVSSGAKFIFADGRKISFIGADLIVLQEMCLYIRELRPDFNGFVFGRRAAMILAAVKAFKPRDRNLNTT